MSDLVDFLLARIAEDQAQARDATAGPWIPHDQGWETPDGRWFITAPYHELDITADDMRHITRWQPGRVLAECEAKRRIVEQYAHHLDQVRAYRSPRWADAMNDQDRERARQAEARHAVSEDAARLLAMPHADHPDYRQEWAP